MTFSKAVAMRTVDLLLKHNMSQYKIIKITGLSASTLKGIMKEQTKDVKLSTIAVIASAFGMGVDEFCGDKLFNKNNLDY